MNSTYTTEPSLVWNTELNFRGGHYSCIAVIIHGLIFAHWQVLRKINPLVTVKSDLCTSHVDQVLHVHFDGGNSHDGDTSYKAIWETAVTEELECR